MCARETTVTPARDEPTEEQAAHATHINAGYARRDTAHSFRKSTAQRPLPLPQKNSLHVFLASRYRCARYVPSQLNWPGIHSQNPVKSRVREPGAALASCSISM